jgi:hypothetical protein
MFVDLFIECKLFIIRYLCYIRKNMGLDMLMLGEALAG